MNFHILQKVQGYSASISLCCKTSVGLKHNVMALTSPAANKRKKMNGDDTGGPPPQVYTITICILSSAASSTSDYTVFQRTDWLVLLCVFFSVISNATCSGAG